MGVKIIFVGNSLMGDDGIGPRLYSELKDSSGMESFELLELGVIGFDMISYVFDDDQLIIVDAVQMKEHRFGEVVLLEEKDFSTDLRVISQHDFGVENTSAMLRLFRPGLKNITLVGVCVGSVSGPSDKLSDEMEQSLPRIKEEVSKMILSIVE